MASAPAFSILLANATEATTGITFTPCAFHISIYFPGLPAPVVTTLTPSSHTILAISSACTSISIIFTPKGLSVSFLAFLISSLTQSVGAVPVIIPRPPASLTAAAKDASAIQAIPP